MGVDISYIVPVYNALPYLEKTVESLLGQDYDARRIELLFIDDGSTDGSGQFLDELAGEFRQMRVYHIEASGGPSVPRNAGLDHATGDYVFFCDADDWMERDATSRMLAHAREWGCDVMLVKPKGENGRPVANAAFRRTLAHADVYDSGACQALGPCKLFRRSFLEDAGLRFEWNWNVWEDQPFVLGAYLAARVVSVAADGVYCHWTRRDDGESASDARGSASYSDVRTYLATMMGIFDERADRERARRKMAQRVLREGLFYAGRALGDEERGGADVSGRFEELHALVEPYLCESFYALCNTQRSLMYRAFQSRDLRSWLDICARRSDDGAFARERFVVDDGLRTIEAVWEGDGRIAVDARGRLPLDFTLTGLVWRDGGVLSVEGTCGARCLYGQRAVLLRLAKRGRGEWVEVPMSAESGSAGWKLTADVFPSVFSECGRAAYWDATVVVEYENGRERRQRVKVPAAGRMDALGKPMPAHSASVAPYATVKGSLSFIDYLYGAHLDVERKFVGATLELTGVAEHAYRVLGEVPVVLERKGDRHVVGFTTDGRRRDVRFSAWRYTPLL